MTKVYTPAGIQELDFEVGPGEFVRGATWVRGSGQINVPVGDVDLYVSEPLELVGIVILTGDAAGSCVVDIWKDVFANFPPTVADTIFASGKPTISGGTTYSDFVLSSVTTTFAAGDTLRFHLQSSSIFNHVSIFLILRPT